MDSVFAGSIKGSNLKVGNRLYVMGDINDSTIYLGYAFVEDPEIKYQKQLFLQKKKGLQDLLLALIQQKSELERKKKLTIEHINKLKKNQAEGFNADALLNMQYRALETSFNPIEKKVSEFQKELDVYRKLSMVMAIDESNPYERYDPEIVVKGKIGSEVQIYGPDGLFKLEKDLEHVILKQDKSSGKFNIQPL
jgi:hypothetical protein